MDLLLDNNIILNLCLEQAFQGDDSTRAIAMCMNSGGRVWIYVGSVQMLEYLLQNKLQQKANDHNQTASNDEIRTRACDLLRNFSADKHWLSALPDEGNVFTCQNCEQEQLIRSLERFPSGSIKVLTNDAGFQENYPDATVSPEQYCRLSIVDPQIQLNDLGAQQDVIRPELEKKIHTVLHHGRYILGPEVQEFEKQLADFVGVKHCVGVSSGTDALLMALMARGIGPGDAVFTTPFTFIATAEVISLLGSTPVFVDIDQQTFNLDPIQLERAIKALQTHDPTLYPLPADHSSLTAKAIVTVDLFGLPADYDPIMNLAAQNNLFVLEDAAQGLGGIYKGKQAGSLGHASATSFFPAKPLGCYGDGGAVLTDDDDLADLARSIRVHGKGTGKYNNIRIGLNARLHTLQASVLLAKLAVFPEEIKARQKVAQRYSEGLAGSSVIKVPFIPAQLQSVWAQYSILSENRSELQETLKKYNIPTAVYYGCPLHQQPAYADLGYDRGDMPVSENISEKIFSLPMHPYLKNKIIDSVVNIVANAVE